MNSRQKLIYALAGFVLGVMVISAASFLSARSRFYTFERVAARVKAVKNSGVRISSGAYSVTQKATDPIEYLFRIVFILFIISPPIIVVLLVIIIRKMDAKKLE